MLFGGPREYLIIETYTDNEKFLRANSTTVCRDALCSTTSQADTIVSQCTTLVLRDLPRKGGAYVFGRGGESDVVMPWGSVSRKHFRVYHDTRLCSWVVQAISRTTVNGLELSSPGRTAPLKFDFANRVVVSNRFVFYLRAHWLVDASIFEQASLSGLGNLAIESETGTQTATQVDLSSRTSRLPTATLGSAVGIPTALDIDKSPPSSDQGASYHLLRRMVWRDTYYVQDLNSGLLLAAEKISSEKRAREVLAWRMDVYDQHCPRAVDICALDGSIFLVTELPVPNWSSLELAEWNPPSEREAFVLLIELMATLEYLHTLGIFHGDITPHNIMVHSLSPRSPQFVLAKLSDARRPDGDFDAYHENDVRMALQAVCRSRVGQTFLGDPIAAPIFDRLLTAVESNSAQEIRHAFNPITLHGTPGFQFAAINFSRSFPLHNILGRYYRKSDLAAIARAHFTQDIYKAWWVHERIMDMDAIGDIPSPYGEYVHWEAARLIFSRLGCDAIDLQPPFATQAVVEHHLSFRITMYDDDLWNISQLLTVLQPVDSLVIQPQRTLRVLGEVDATGLYVDTKTFVDACNAIQVSQVLNETRKICTEYLGSNVAAQQDPCPPPAHSPLQSCFRRPSLKRPHRPDKLKSGEHIERKVERLFGQRFKGREVMKAVGSMRTPLSVSDPNPLNQSDLLVPHDRNPESSFLMADRKLLLGIAHFDRISRTLSYCGSEYSESNAFQICEQFKLDALKDGIQKSGHPDVDSLLAGNRMVDCYATDDEYSSESRWSVFHERGFQDLKQRPVVLNVYDAEQARQEVSRVQQWVANQRSRKRKRYLSAADIKPTRWAATERSWTYSVKKNTSELSTPSQVSTASVPGSPATKILGNKLPKNWSTTEADSECEQQDTGLMMDEQISWSSTEVDPTNHGDRTVRAESTEVSIEE